MIDEKQISYTAASVFPSKVLIHKKLNEELREKKKIIPIHIQLNPTNICNLDCHFCSCANRNKGIELPYEDVMEIMTKAKKVGCEAVTINWRRRTSNA